MTPLWQVDDGLVLNLLPVWAPDAVTRKKILVDNPARLLRVLVLSVSARGWTCMSAAQCVLNVLSAVALMPSLPSVAADVFFRPGPCGLSSLWRRAAALTI